MKSANAKLYGISMERGGSTFCFRIIETVCVVFVTIVGPQMEVCDDLHLLKRDLQHVFLEKRVPNAFNRLCSRRFMTSSGQHGGRSSTRRPNRDGSKRDYFRSENGGISMVVRESLYDEDRPDPSIDE